MPRKKQTIVYAVSEVNEGEFMVSLSLESYFVENGCQDDCPDDPAYERLLDEPLMEGFIEVSENVLEVPEDFETKEQIIEHLNGIPYMKHDEAFEEFINNRSKDE